MTPQELTQFREVWLVDFEFQQPDGDRPIPLLMVAHELHKRQTIRLWGDELGQSSSPPFFVSDDALFVAYYASAEIGCMRALGWPLPRRVLDLFTEFRCNTNGLNLTQGSGLLGALTYHGLRAMAVAEKAIAREMILRGGPYSPREQEAITAYCEADVMSLKLLLDAMLPSISLPHALIRGRYMIAAAAMEYVGTPIDVSSLQLISTNWDRIKRRLIDRIDCHFGVYEDGSFSNDRFAQYLERRKIEWPRTETGRLKLDDDTFKTKALELPEIGLLRELRYTLSKLRLNDLAVGVDNRNRCLLSAFRAETGRNAPSTTKFAFGPAVWFRHLIKPGPGRSLAYIDYEQQEFGIAAALSGDDAMKIAYLSGDPYLQFAKQSGAVPVDATKYTHSRERDKFKACILAVQYGMGTKSLAARLGISEVEANLLLHFHRKTYRKFWEWIDCVVDDAVLRGEIQTVFGWKRQIEGKPNPRSLANFPMQANGAEILRLACCMLTEGGIEVCAPVHDALLVESQTEDIDTVVARSQTIMAEAASIVLGGFALRTEAKIIRHPHRWEDKRGKVIWDLVMNMLSEGADPLSHRGPGTCPAVGHPDVLITSFDGK